MKNVPFLYSYLVSYLKSRYDPVLSFDEFKIILGTFYHIPRANIMFLINDLVSYGLVKFNRSEKVIHVL